MTDPGWLPALVPCEEDREWADYLEEIYGIFKKDFIDSKPVFRGRRLGLKRHPLFDEKEATFWHIITDGPQEHQRVPTRRRCERVRWPRAMIDAAAKDGLVNCWLQKRDRENRIAIGLLDFSYVVILADRGNYLLPWTAFVVDPRRRSKLENEWKAAPLK